MLEPKQLTAAPRGETRVNGSAKVPVGILVFLAGYPTGFRERFPISIYSGADFRFASGGHAVLGLRFGVGNKAESYEIHKGSYAFVELVLRIHCQPLAKAFGRGQQEM